MNLHKIKIRCEEAKISIRALCKEIDMSEQNLHKCIREDRIEAGNLEKIAKILNVPITYFFEEGVQTSPLSGNQDDSQKINKLLEHHKLNEFDFARSIRVDVQKVYDIQEGKSCIDRYMYEKILSTYPSTNAVWLLYREGEHNSVSNLLIERVYKEFIERKDVEINTLCKEINQLHREIGSLQSDKRNIQDELDATKKEKDAEIERLNKILDDAGIEYKKDKAA